MYFTPKPFSQRLVPQGEEDEETTLVLCSNTWDWNWDFGDHSQMLQLDLLIHGSILQESEVFLPMTR